MKEKIEIEIDRQNWVHPVSTIYLPKELVGSGFRWAYAPEAEEPAQPQPEPWKRWRAEKAGYYFYINSNGSIDPDVENDYERDGTCYAFGNYFRTKLLAERHAKRLRSMVPTCAMPKDGDFYSFVFIDLTGAKVSRIAWKDDPTDFYYYFTGRVFATKEAAEAWIAEFGDVWTSRVDGEGE